MTQKRRYKSFRDLIFCLLLQVVFAFKAQAIESPLSRSAEDLVLGAPLTLSNAADLDDPKSDRPNITAVADRFSDLRPIAAALDLDPKIINSSPVLQRWMKEIPNVAADIANDPSFRARIRLHYFGDRDSHPLSNLKIGIEEIRLGHSHATISADFQGASNHHAESWGTDVHYYVYPLGNYVNVAPVIGYRHLSVNTDSTSGVNLGVRLLLVLSRGGGADVSLTQTWVAPGSDHEAGLSILSFGYALSHQVRLSTELQRQTTRRGSDNRVGIGLEWML